MRRTVSTNADSFAQTLAPVLADIRAEGSTTLRSIASELNIRGIRTRRGGAWHISTVQALLARLQGQARRRR